MGLISGLLTLPLAPVRGTMRVAELLQSQADKELSDEASINAALHELQELRESGEMSEEELEQAENALVERLLAIRGLTQGGSHGFPE